MLLFFVTLTSLSLQNYVHSLESIQRHFYSLEEATTLFENFIKEHNKNYDDKEKEARFKIFVDNLEEINSLNQNSSGAVFGINKFSDLTKDEFLRFHTGFKLDKSWEFEHTEAYDFESTKFVAPDEFDWRSKGVVSKVKDQGSICGSCWAFSACGNVESINAIKTGNIIDVSEQQLVDCDKKSHGCSGGLPWDALSYLVENGAMSFSSYLYAGFNQSCQYDSSNVVIRLKSYKHIMNLTEDEIKEYLYNIGPLSIAIAGEAVEAYTGGIMKNWECNISDAITHAVLLVGYGKEKDVEYWIIKNSWGYNWGENGYFRMQRGVNCLLLTKFGISTAVI